MDPVANAMIEMASLDAKGQKVGGVLFRPYEAASELRWFDEYPAIETHIRTEVQSGATFVGIVFYPKGSSKPSCSLCEKVRRFSSRDRLNTTRLIISPAPSGQ